MQRALEILGYRCYHGLTLITNLQDTAKWNEALDAKFFDKGSRFRRAKWNELFEGYEALSDMPAVAFAEDLIECYPHAKVVLVEPDLEQWYQRFDDEEIANIWRPSLRFLARLDSNFIGKLGSVSGRWVEGWMKARSRTEMQANARPKYREHNALVKRLTPSEQLLVFRLDQGWEPLCTFLHRPIPAMAFPRIDESSALQGEIRSVLWVGLMNLFPSFAKVALATAVLALALWAVRAERG